MRDGDGRVVKSIQMLNGTAITTSYRYAPFGLLDLVLDDAHNQTQSHYDLAGRLIHEQDLNAGTVDFTYDGFDDLLTKKHLESGELNDLQLLRARPGARPPKGPMASARSTGMRQSTASAGSPAPRARTTSRRSSSMMRRGARAAFQQTVDGKSYEVGVVYDSQGRIGKLRYPAIDATKGPALTLQYTYNPSGILSEIGFCRPGCNLSAAPVHQRPKPRRCDGARKAGKWADRTAFVRAGHRAPRRSEPRQWRHYAIRASLCVLAQWSFEDPE